MACQNPWKSLGSFEHCQLETLLTCHFWKPTWKSAFQPNFSNPNQRMKLPTKNQGSIIRGYPPGNDYIDLPSPFGTFESMMFIFLRWDMLVPLRVAPIFVETFQRVSSRNKNTTRKTNPLETPVGNESLCFTVSFAACGLNPYGFGASLWSNLLMAHAMNMGVHLEILGGLFFAINTHVI